MSDPTPAAIEHTARIVAGANGDDVDFSRVHSFQGIGDSEPVPTAREYLSDHRTVARYFAYVRENVISQPPPYYYRRENIGLNDMFEKHWYTALREPMPAIIALVAAVEGGEA